jgi:hypothetical protein
MMLGGFKAPSSGPVEASGRSATTGKHQKTPKTSQLAPNDAPSKTSGTDRWPKHLHASQWPNGCQAMACRSLTQPSLDDALYLSGSYAQGCHTAPAGLETVTWRSPCARSYDVTYVLFSGVISLFWTISCFHWRLRDLESERKCREA